MTFTVIVLPSAQKELDELPASLRKTVLRKILSLRDNPYPSGSKKLKGSDGFYRLRVGNYRVIYEVNGNILYVYGIRIGHRKDVYRRPWF
ncbi:MAG: type II toxin-antitoxin system RelE/ParE family toxin [Phycisphaerae bacterium]